MRACANPRVTHAFQVPCPACVTHGLPQATRTRERFTAKPHRKRPTHSVLAARAHDAAAPDAFVHESRQTFGSGIGTPARVSALTTIRQEISTGWAL